MSLEQAFLADIIASPDDDAPRLVYADWLEENGDPEWGDFIRAQCQLARRRVVGGRAERKRLTRRVEALFASNVERWRERFPSLRCATLDSWRRGFPCDSVVNGLDELVRGPAIFQEAPLTRLSPLLRPLRAGDGARVASMPELGQLRALEFLLGGASEERDLDSEDEELAALLSSPHLGRLERLSVAIVRVGPRSLRAIVKLPGLRSLDLCNDGVNDRAVRLLVRSGVAARLTELGLCGRLTAGAARAVSEAPALAGLRKLGLAVMRGGDEAVRHLAASPHLMGLRALELSSDALSDDALAALAASRALGGLRQLNLVAARTGAAGLRRLIASSVLSRQLHLDLAHRPGENDDRGLRLALRRRFRKVNFW